MTNINEGLTDKSSVEDVIAKTRELAAKATRTPVVAGGRDIRAYYLHYDHRMAYASTDENAAFIAHACNSILELADEVERLRLEQGRAWAESECDRLTAQLNDVCTENEALWRVVDLANSSTCKHSNDWNDCELCDALATLPKREVST